MSSYAEDTAVVVKMMKLTRVCLGIAIALVIVWVAFDQTWARRVETLPLALATIATFVRARAEKRLGRSPVGSYLRAGLWAIMALNCTF
jgi:hypothetical protein